MELKAMGLNKMVQEGREGEREWSAPVEKEADSDYLTRARPIRALPWEFSLWDGEALLLLHPVEEASLQEEKMSSSER